MLFDLFSDLFKWLKGLIDDIFGMLTELSGNPLVQRILDDTKKAFARGFGSIGKSVSDGIKSFNKKREGSKWIDVAYQASLVLIAFAVIIVLVGVGVFFEVGDRFDKRSVVVNVPVGAGASDVCDILIDKGVIHNRYGFGVLVGMMGLEGRIEAGTYRLSPSMGLGTIALKLKRGEILSGPLSKVFFPEGASIYRMGVILQESGFRSGIYFDDMTKSAISSDLREKFPFLKGDKVDSLEGYLFPDTYLIPPDASADVIRDLMLSRFSSVVLPFWERASKDTTMSLHEIMTLASIIEKEAALEEERPIIASVFLNRLNKRMHLAADPTVKYALSQFRKPTKKVYFIDLEVDSPYNTYRYLGLPPGPIANPGLASIKAAVYPAKTSFLYFVARKDGTHIFSTTWQEHERAKTLIRGE